MTDVSEKQRRMYTRPELRFFGRMTGTGGSPGIINGSPSDGENDDPAAHVAPQPPDAPSQSGG